MLSLTTTYVEGVPKFMDFFVFRSSDEFSFDEFANAVNDKAYVAGSMKISDSISEVIS